jgi:hypothetical protein
MRVSLCYEGYEGHEGHEGHEGQVLSFASGRGKAKNKT